MCRRGRPTDVRRPALLTWLAGSVVAAIVAAACGGSDAPEGHTTVRLLTDVERLPADPSTDPHLAGDAVSSFGTELLGAALQTAVAGSNVIVSPASVAIALAMMEPGAVGAARTQLRELLHIEDPTAFHASMSALEQRLEAREPAAPIATDEEPGELVARIANGAFLQQGYPFEAAYLEAIGRSYGPVLRELDYEPDPDAAAHEINRFVADATNDRIPELIADGVLQRDTVLTLVNALYLKASWQSVFDAASTEDKDFTRLDGSTVTVPLMQGEADATARGDGWVGASKQYVGNLVAQFVLPDDGRFDEVASEVGRAFATFESEPRGGAPLSLPRFETRHHEELSPALKALGLTAPYERGGLLGIARSDTLVLDAVIHETYLAMDETGTEAAAATAAVFRDVSAPLDPPGPVVLDRPFLFRIYDLETGATLFLGQVLDPTG